MSQLPEFYFSKEFEIDGDMFYGELLVRITSAYQAKPNYRADNPDDYYGYTEQSWEPVLLGLSTVDGEEVVMEDYDMDNFVDLYWEDIESFAYCVVTEYFQAQEIAEEYERDDDDGFDYDAIERY